MIPASGFYEWPEIKDPGKPKPIKQPFCVSRKDLPLTFAGLWERWGPENLLTCTILTAEPCDGIRDLHNRMPLMLAKDGFEPWLSGKEPAVDPGIDEAVQVVPLSPKMNSPRYNEPDCIEALAVAGSP